MSTPEQLRSRSLPIAVASLGVVVTGVALVRPWQHVGVAKTGAESPLARYTYGVDMLGYWGMAYLLIVVAVIPVVALTVFSHSPVRDTARTLALSLAGTGAGLTALMIYRIHDTGLGLYFSDGIDSLPTQILPGAWAGLAAVAVLGGAAYLARPVTKADLADDLEDDFEKDEPAYGGGIEVIDMTVKAG
jgi:hypothetical protein